MLPLSLYALLHVRAVQNYAVRHIAEYLSEELGTEVKVGGVNIAPFRSIILTDVAINDLDGTSLLGVERMGLIINKLSIRNKQLIVTELSIEGGRLNVNRVDEENHYNFQFLIDYFSNGDKPDNGLSNWNAHVLSLRLSNATLHFQDNKRPFRINGSTLTAVSIHDINLAVREIRLASRMLAFELDYLMYRESQGFKVDYLSGSFELDDNGAMINNFLLRTGNTELSFDLILDFDSLSSESLFSPFSRGFSYSLELLPSVIELADVGHYFSPIYGINSTVSLNGKFTGDRTELMADNIMLSTGNDTHFNGSFSLTDLDEIVNAGLDLNVFAFKSSIADLSSFRLPDSFEQTYIILPEYLFSLGKVFFSGELNGSLNDFRADGKLVTDIGSLQSDIEFKQISGRERYAYRGQLSTDSFDLGRFTGNAKYIGVVDMTAEVSGAGFDIENLEMDIDGEITTMDMLDHQYNNLKLQGAFADKKFIGSFLVDDSDIYLDFNGKIDFGKAIPEFDFRAVVDGANMTAMNLYQRDSLMNSILSAEFVINARARSIDDLEGVILLRDILYEETPLSGRFTEHDIKQYATDSIYISNTLWPQNNKHLRIRSEFVDADLHGMINFSGIGRSVIDYIYTYLPAMDADNDRLDVTTENGQNNHQDIIYTVRFKDTDMLSDLFFPSIRVAGDSWISGGYNSFRNDVGFEAFSEKIELAGRELENWHVRGTAETEHFLIESWSDRFLLSDSLFFESLEMEISATANMVKLDLLWNKSDTTGQNTGHLQGQSHVIGPQLFEFEFLPSHAYFDGDKWQINTDHKVIVDRERIEIHQLMAYHKDQFIRADGVLSADAGDRMTLSFASFDVAYSEYLMNTKNFDFGGIMNGYVSFTGMYQPPSIGAELLVDDFAFNHIVLGNLDVQSIWDKDKGAFRVDADITASGEEKVHKPLIVSGFIYPDGDDRNFDLDLILDKKNMAVWGRYMASFADHFRGLATGNLRMDGPFHSPELSGSALVEQGGLHIPYLNTGYTFDHKVVFEKGSLRLDALLLNDSLGNTGLLTGELLHNAFKDFAFDLHLAPERMVIFNTNQHSGDFYYGTAFLTGLAHIHGPATDVILDVSARTNRGTNVILPLNYSGEIRESRFITFVSNDTLQKGQSVAFPEMRGGLTLNFDLEVTSDADVHMYFDTRFGDVIRASGAGDLRMEVSPQGAFNIYGDYVIEDGEYMFSLQNIINKRFRIEQGSTVRWAGDMNDADVDLRAAYRLRTPLYDLLAGEGVDNATSDIYRRRIPVETMLILEDKLFNPTISFEILVPGGDENTRELIERVITTEQEMNRQVFSLLVLNRFMPATTDQYNTALGYGVGSTSSELLSNQLSNWLSQISTDFDIGVNYRPGDELSSQEVELALSTQLFDDRVLIDGNFGYAGNETATGNSAQSASQIIGDVNIEVKITPEGKFRVKAFNRSNTFDIINTSSPYTQGIGLFYRKEFDDFSDLFRRVRRPEEFGGMLNDPASIGGTGVFSRDGNDAADQ
jgi:hypothetical protein